MCEGKHFFPSFKHAGYFFKQSPSLQIFTFLLGTYIHQGPGTRPKAEAHVLIGKFALIVKPGGVRGRAREEGGKPALKASTTPRPLLCSAPLETPSARGCLPLHASFGDEAGCKRCLEQHRGFSSTCPARRVLGPPSTSHLLLRALGTAAKGAEMSGSCFERCGRRTESPRSRAFALCPGLAAFSSFPPASPSGLRKEQLCLVYKGSVDILL